MSRATPSSLKEFYTSREPVYTPTNRIQTGPSTFPPQYPVTGTVYYATDLQLLYVYTGIAWLPIEGGSRVPNTGTVSSVAPSDPFPGQIWVHPSGLVNVRDTSGNWIPTSASSVINSSTPPVNPFQGQVWISGTDPSQVIQMSDASGQWHVIGQTPVAIGDVTGLSERLSNLDSSGAYIGDLTVDRVTGLTEKLSNIDASGNYTGLIDPSQVQFQYLDQVSGNYTGSIQADQIVDQPLFFVLTDETTPVSVQNSVFSFRAFKTMTMTQVPRIYLTSSGSSPTNVRIKVNSMLMLTQDLSIDAGETSSVTSSVSPSLALPAIFENDLVTVDVTGTGSGALGLKMCMFVGLDAEEVAAEISARAARVYEVDTGTFGYMTIPWQMYTTTFSISCWFKPKNFATTQVFISNFDPLNDHWFISMTTDGHIYHGFGDGAFSPNNLFVANTWYFLTCTFNNAANCRRNTYVNAGVQWSNTGGTVRGSAATAYTYSHVFSLMGNDQLNAYVQNFCIWNSELTQGEVTSLYNAGQTADYLVSQDTSKMVGYYKFNTALGLGKDSSPAARHMTVV